ncbi:LAQU0S06e03268g1_1 [Lachancea quebecensis]|uniref:LAQU0S06e03268g1_1 n=1 Tax=Lachancea quebecensis TaxID=1654605 RepID=A0A0P1KRI4_9SACH|nr:LAQU0S06e03268g1_1 [Lachancea quebecensis]
MTFETAESLADQILSFLSDKLESNYRVAVIVVGPPGSGKSTISEKLCREINSRYNKYLNKSGSRPCLQENLSERVNICEGIPQLDENSLQDLQKGFFNHVQDQEFQPKRFVDKKDDSEVIVGIGGLPNSIRVENVAPAEPLNHDYKIAQIVPMDGFHLSRRHLDHFDDPAEAHRRRGSPPTFDSNNCLQLCKLLAKTCTIKPTLTLKKSAPGSDILFDRISETFSKSVPSIYVPGFDHALKDPSTGQHCVDAFTRIIVLEGLYLLLDEDNWREIYPTFKETHAVIVWKLDLGVDVLEQRVAKRHLDSGLAATLEAGVERFRMNDLINALKIKEHSLAADDIVSISNN